jgi:3-phosphoshikimate 1-carboxyvinyltransferase
MKYVSPSEIEGTVQAPPSKSMMVRAVAAATLAAGTTEILGPSFCQDALAALGIARSMGAEVEIGRTSVRIRGPIRTHGGRIDCGESGLCMRLFTAIASLGRAETLLDARGSLLTRPVDMIQAPLVRMGVDCQSEGGLPPVRVRGPLRGGEAVVDGSTSSQFLSGLLMTLPVCMQDSRVRVIQPRSLPYVWMTMALLEDFGIVVKADEMYTVFDIKGGQTYQPMRYPVEGDYSGAAFLLVAGAIAGRARIMNLADTSLQADRRLLDALFMAGARVEAQADAVVVEERKLTGFEFDATQCPDLFPPLVALACHCKGTSRISGVGRLWHKESDRASALLVEFGKMGARIRAEENDLLVEGSGLTGAAVDSHNDHRIAMACAVAALRSRKGVSIGDPGCVDKSYPGFFRDLESMGARVR